MAVYEYAEQFEKELDKKYARELTSYPLTQSNQGIKFLNAQTIKIPKMSVSGYKDHDRSSIGFNSGTITNSWEPKKLEHDRDIEFAIDPMDIDETNLVTEVANIQNTFEEEQAIPEKDSYRYSKLYSEATKYSSAGARIITDTVSESNILSWFDDQNEYMDDKGVTNNRYLFCTPAFYKLIKNAEKIQRQINVNSAGPINRNVTSLDDVSFIKVPSDRMKTLYDFTNGCVSATGAKQIHSILVEPNCVIARDKYAYMKLFTPGTDSRTADKYIYQNRYYTDTFLLENKSCGISILAEA